MGSNSEIQILVVENSVVSYLILVGVIIIILFGSGKYLVKYYLIKSERDNIAQVDA